MHILLLFCLLSLGAGKEITEKEIPQLAHFRRALHNELNGNTGPKPDVLQLSNEAGAVPACTAGPACMKTFLSGLGLSTLPPQASSFLAALQSLLAQKQLPAFLAACNQLTSLKSCLGSQFNGCLASPVNLMSNFGLDYGNSLTYTSIFYALNYGCGAGASALTTGFQCVNNILTQNATQLSSCISTLNSQIVASPSQACLDYQIFTACYSQVFHGPCGENVAYNLCQAIRQGILTAQPQCYMLTCPFVNN